MTTKKRAVGEPGGSHAAAPAKRAWLVDLDGTLYHPLPVKLAMGVELALLGAGSIAAIRAFRAQHERIRDEQQGELEPSPFEWQLERAAEVAGLPIEALRASVAEWMVARPGKWIRSFRRRSLLAELASYRRAGGRTALVSDYPASSKLRALGAEGLFDLVVSNGEPGGPPRLKPWPDGYLSAAQQLGVAPADCLVIGDRADADGLAAERAGMSFRLVR